MGGTTAPSGHCSNEKNDRNYDEISTTECDPYVPFLKSTPLEGMKGTMVGLHFNSSWPLYKWHSSIHPYVIIHPSIHTSMSLLCDWPTWQCF